MTLFGPTSNAHSGQPVCKLGTLVFELPRWFSWGFTSPQAQRASDQAQVEDPEVVRLCWGAQGSQSEILSVGDQGLFTTCGWRFVHQLWLMIGQRVQSVLEL